MVQRLSELGLEAPDKDQYSRAHRSVKALIFALLKEAEEAREGRGRGVPLSDEEIQYIIYRLRTVYGDDMATRIVSKLSDFLRSRGGQAGPRA
ncbi:hypothetical protein DRO32_01820 [Candidatus Bathyarchaeota archaeon]|nr:MAG: hypothetical protein DRO32_01820 [Candidatus Bathyarchaeota archaeon]